MRQILSRTNVGLPWRQEFRLPFRPVSEVSGVIPCLIEVLKEVREDAGRELRHIRYHYARAERQLERYEASESLPPAGELGELVRAYALECNRDPFDLWDEAVRRARAIGSAEAANDSGEPGGGIPPRDLLGPDDDEAQSESA